MTAPLLLIEDMPSLQMVYEAVLHKAGFAVTSASSAAEGLQKFRAGRPDVVLLDLRLPDRCGLKLMADLLAEKPGLRVIVITANGSINMAVEAMRAGAFEFLVKPFDETRLISVIENAQAGIAPAPPPGADPETGAEGRFHGFIGASPPMQELYRKIAAIGRSMATVFISGESGTGKELAAQAVHATSSRANGPFVPLNCGAIPTDLLESEVFGHLKGAFTGAISDKLGAAGAADGGTLFLDEICEMDMNLQTKLLRFLQTSTILPVGATQARKVNVRIICATNRDPHEEVRAGRFREDLFYRLHVVPITLPPLRERGDDVVVIAKYLLSKYSQEYGSAVKGFTPGALAAMRKYHWPGNVRQLENRIKKAIVLADKTLVGSEDLDLFPEALKPIAPLSEAREEFTRRYILEVLERNDGNRTKTARDLGVDPRTIFRYLEREPDAPEPGRARD